MNKNINNINAKLSAAVAMAVLMASTIAPSAFAASSSVTIKNTGVNSTTTVKVNNTNNVAVFQSNNTNVKTGLVVISNTGNNKANNNTGGKVNVTSGNSTTNVNVTVGGSINYATLPDCLCDTANQTVNIKNTGAKSTVTVKAGTQNNTLVGQQTNTNVTTLGFVVSNTGNNEANGNTSGKTSVTSGDSTTGLTVNVSGSSNTQL